MNTDFFDAHHRHWRDAEWLFESGWLANADHLYGIAAECGLKCLMVVFGMPQKNGDPSDRCDRKHANEIWERYEAYRSSYSQGAAFNLFIFPLGVANRSSFNGALLMRDHGSLV
uniref:Uncharacterized protein n=1 Tax=Candidatus Kentrum sp. FW TaxID=2126338 RepID=A0A450TR90_9GAMM|nr:MAG: hypothetical protein BECKFW1821B_GA0114236_11973 [Candidatus Kentron sp. FW]